MKKNKLKKITWEDISLKQFKEIDLILNSEYDDEFEKLIRLMCIISGKDEDYFNSIPVVELSSVKDSFTAFLSEPPKPRLDKSKLEYKTGDYYCMLNPDISKMPTSQYIDYTSVLAKYPDNLSKLISILLIPKGKEYNDGSYDLKTHCDNIEVTFKYVDALGIGFFLKKKLEALSDAIKTYSEKQMKKVIAMEKDPDKKRLARKFLEVSKKIGHGS